MDNQCRFYQISLQMQEQNALRMKLKFKVNTLFVEKIKNKIKSVKKEAFSNLTT